MTASFREVLLHEEECGSLKRGKLTTITGCMGSNKSGILVHEGTGACSIGCLVFYFKSVLDKRDENIHSMNGGSVRCTKIEYPRDIPSQIEKHFDDNPTDMELWGEGRAVICIDEASFFQPTNLEPVVDFLLYWGFHLYIVTLNQLFNGEVFGPAGFLLAKADKIIHAKAHCHGCGSLDSATKSYRVSNSPENKEVGSVGKEYMVYCPSCWQENMIKNKKEVPNARRFFILDK